MQPRIFVLCLDTKLLLFRDAGSLNYGKSRLFILTYCQLVVAGVSTLGLAQNYCLVKMVVMAKKLDEEATLRLIARLGL